MADDAWQLEEALRPTAAVTRELFLEWRRARTGSGNPERMTNPVWAWLAQRPEVNAWQANKHFGGEPGGHPGWCNQRFGQSTTELADGRTLRIAGEHEDYYDPDFCIYNDVIVTTPDGGLEIYGYALDAFPATDFHSATVVGDHVYLIGNLGYRETRGPRTQVLRLDVRTLAIERLEAGGESPGWISKHAAALDGTGIKVSGGRCEVELAGSRTLRDLVDDHVLDLTTLTWRRVTDRRWSQYEIERGDGAPCQLWEVAQLAWHAERADDEWSQQQAASYRARLGREPDLAAWRDRFAPPLAHEARGQDPEEWRVSRVVIDGVVVRYVDSSRGADVVIEGQLPAATVAALVDDVREKLSRADGGRYTARCLDDGG